MRAYKKSNSWLTLFLTMLIVSGPAAYAQIDQPVLSCDFGDVVFDLSFSSARLNSCKQTGDAVFSVSTAPENVPINPSPWYAFKLYSETPQDVTVFLHYPVSRHRYWPKISSDGVNWQPVAEQDFQLLFDGKSVKMRLEAGPDALWVAAQEIVDNRFYDEFTRELADLDFLDRKIIGLSAEQRPVYMLETTAPAERYVVLIGRQHPPEISGALAMTHFVERILRDDPLANAFRAQYGLLITPNMNPDGVEHGFWRHNTGGIDLNRDWGPFSQPETRLMRDQLSRFREPGSPRLSLFLDFHSTNRDVFYTPTREVTQHLPEFTELWLSEVQARMQQIYADYEVEAVPGYNAESAVAKNWISQIFGVPAITVEIGDNTSRAMINSLAVIAAEEMMALLLSFEN